MPSHHHEIALARTVPAFRFHYVDDNQMAPTYFSGDWLIFMPVDDYKGEGDPAA
jgi:hypothetical protein